RGGPPSFPTRRSSDLGAPRGRDPSAPRRHGRAPSSLLTRYKGPFLTFGRARASCHYAGSVMTPRIPVLLSTSSVFPEPTSAAFRSEEHTSELQSREKL